MPVDVIVGGQGGDEGKGKISAYLSLHKDYSICMRVPSPQAGHSIYCNKKRVGLALLPCAVVNPDMRLLIGAGGLISLSKLKKEIEDTELKLNRLGIDYKATIVTPEHLAEEISNQHLMGKIGSVGTGVGPCRRDKIMRKPDLKFAKDIPDLEKYLTDTKKEIFDVLEKHQNILLEGDHGAKLDLIHGEYPYVTSRSTNASGFLSEAGIGPKDVRDVYIILKPYETRVASGPLKEEIFGKEQLEWAHEQGGETGTVSKRLRRVGKFDIEQVREVIKMNSATKIAVTHMDCFKEIGDAIGYKSDSEFLNMISKEFLNKPPYPKLALFSYGPNIEDIIKYES